MSVGVVCSILGCYVVLRGMTFLGDALAHTILPGVVIAFLIGWPLAVGALIVGILAALGIGLMLFSFLIAVGWTDDPKPFHAIHVRYVATGGVSEKALAQAIGELDRLDDATVGLGLQLQDCEQHQLLELTDSGLSLGHW